MREYDVLVVLACRSSPRSVPGRLRPISGRPPPRWKGREHRVVSTVRPSRSPHQEHLMKLSARNQIPARVTGIQAGEAIANIELDANGVRMVASITLEAAKQLGLTEGSDVIAIIKASDVIVATAD